MSGEFTSPNWPLGDYGPKAVCTWRINVPAANKITVGFSHFELQATNILGNCVDYVEIFNGKTMMSLGWLKHFQHSAEHSVIVLL